MSIGVLVVDDSAVCRQAIERVLGGHSEIVVRGTAHNGREALEKIRQLQPDLVTLDLEMPELDGLSVLREIRRQGLRPRVLVVSGRGGERRTMEALCLGAEDFLVKPSGADSLDQLRHTLLPKVLQFGPPSPAPQPPQAPRQGQGLRPTDVEAVVIGVSTGGPDALARLLPLLPARLKVPVLVVQHMPPQFTPLLAERLGRLCSLPVGQPRQGEPLAPGHIYLAPGDFHMEIAGVSPRIQLQQGPAEHGCRPAADVLFRSAARCYGAGCLAVVLTGMGRDGLEGTRQIVQAGGQALAQDRKSCVVWGMPRLVVEEGLAVELELEKIAAAIVRRSRS